MVTFKKGDNMTISETAKYLRSIGYDAENVNNVVIVYSEELKRPGKREEIRNRLRSIGFKGRWGWRTRKA